MAGQQSDRIKGSEDPESEGSSVYREECRRLQKAFGYSYEEVKTSILNMAKNGAEGTAAMGIDAPLAVFLTSIRTCLDISNSVLHR